MPTEEKPELKEDVSIYETPRVVDDINTCYFYHTIDLPEYGTIEGSWDLRKGVDEYLGNVNFKGKRVLEIGTANGFLCFEMEKRGAEVVAFDLSEDFEWDIVPFAQYNYRSIALERRKILKKLNNAFWFCHRLLKSNARVIYGDVYNIKNTIGLFDIVTFGSMLLHLRDPFRALERGLRFAKEKTVISELLRGRKSNFSGSDIKFLPDYRTIEPKDTWWDLPPAIITRMIGVLGFEDVKINYHAQKYEKKTNDLYTVVGNRTRKFQWELLIHFGLTGNAGKYQLNGWAAPEDGLTWSTGKSASLRIPVAELPQSRITLKADVMAFLCSAVPEQTVHILINGQKAGTWIMRPETRKMSLIIRESLLTDPDTMIITFMTPDAASPSEFGVNDDTRILGIAMHSITFTLSN